MGQASAKVNVHWKEISTFQIRPLSNHSTTTPHYALIEDQLVVIQDQHPNDSVFANTVCNLSIFTSSAAGSSLGDSIQLPFQSKEIRKVLTTLEGVILFLSPDTTSASSKVCFIPIPFKAKDSKLIWLPNLPSGYRLVEGKSNNNSIYLWLNRPKTNKNDQPIRFLSLNLDETVPAWKNLPDVPKGIFRILNVSSQNDGLKDALFVLVESTDSSSGSSAIRLLKYDFQGKFWQSIKSNAAFSFSTETNYQNSIVSTPLGSADILYASKALNKNNASFSLFHTITESWRSVAGEILWHPELPSIANGNEELLQVFTEENTSTLSVKKLVVEVEQEQFSFLNTMIILLYFLILLLLGVFFSKRQVTADDYFKGGQRIPWWAAGLSIYGTGLSAISFMAVPAKTYMTDWAYFMTKLPLILIPIIVSKFFIPFYRKLDLTSAYEYLQKRFNLATRLVGSFAFIIFQLGRIGVVLYLPAIALNIVTGWNVIACILLMGGVSLVYTLMGGIEAVVWTDVLQVFVLVGGIILCLTLISYDVEGGMGGVIQTGIDNQKFEILNMALDWRQPTFWVVVISGFFSNLITYSTDQSIVQRYLATKNVKAAQNSIWTYTWVSLSIGWIFFFVGTALFAFYKAQPDALLPAMSSNDAIFPWYIISQLPDGVSGLLIAGIFAAAMSSLSSSMNSAATAYTIDFHYTFNGKVNGLVIGRWATLIIGLAGITFALLFATMNVKSIWDEFLKIIGLITGGLGGVFLLGIISSRANGAGALIGLLGSGVIQYLLALYQPIHFLLYTASGFLSCLILGYLFSLLLPSYNKPYTGLTIYNR